MLRTRNFFLLIGVVLTLCSCGVKKNATANVESASIETEMNEKNATKADSLPDFLREFANDSTIHINWVYGIPFIIDDSVPMFLPPIDKNPEEYVCNKNYELLQRGNNLNMGKEISICGIKNPVDSIPWLNKCINDLRGYIDSPFIMCSHHYYYIAQVYTIEDSENIIVFSINQRPDWTCRADSTPMMQIGVFYAFDCKGTLLCKTHITEPIRFNKGRPSGEMDKVYPWADKISSMLKEKGQRRTLFRLFFSKPDPNRPTPCPYEV